MRVSLESKSDKNGNPGSGWQCYLALWKSQARRRVGRSERCWMLVEGTSVGIGHLCKVTAAEMGGKGMVVGDSCGLSRRKRESIRKRLWERKPQALGETCAHSARCLWFIYLGKAHSTFPY